MANSVSDAIMNVHGRRTPTPAAEPSGGEPKANPPAEFDGTNRRKLETYIAECEIMFATSPRRFRSERSKVLAAGSYLKGDPKKWFSNFFLLPADQQPAWFDSWTDFKDELRRHWGVEDPEAAAESELKALTMTDKDHVSYFASKFRSVRYRLPNWSDRNLRNSFLNALAPRIRAQFVSAGRVPPNTLDGLIAAAEELDRAYWIDREITNSLKPKEKKSETSKNEETTTTSTSDKKKKKKKAANSNSNSNSTSNPTSSTNDSSKSNEPAYKKLLGADGKLLPKERERRIANGLCMLCGQKGHIATDCSKRKQPSSGTTLAKATISIVPPTATPATGSE
jgi:hypothetical protein